MSDFKELDKYIKANLVRTEHFEAFSAVTGFIPQAKETELFNEACSFNSFYSSEDKEERDIIIELDESFSETLLKLIDEKGLKDSDVYNSINMDRRLFSKIRNSSYSPSKQTAISLCIALKLDLKKTNDLLNKAGYTLSHSNMADVIIEYFIKNGIYDLYTIDEALLHYDQKPLGKY